SLRLHSRRHPLLRFRLAQLWIVRLPCRAQRRVSSASPPLTLASSRRLLSFAAAMAAGGSCGGLGYGAGLIAGSTPFPALVRGVGPALLGVGLAVLLGVGPPGAVRGGAGTAGKL